MATLKTYILFILFYTPIVAGAISFTHLTEQEGLPGSTVYHAMQDSKGFIWFCMETGVSRYDGKKFENFTTIDGLADNVNFKSFEDSKKRIWFASHSGKLSYYYQGRFYNAQNTSWLSRGENNGTLYDIAEDATGTLWMTTSLWNTLSIRDTVITKYPPPFDSYNDVTIHKTLFHLDGRIKNCAVDLQGNIFLLDVASQKTTLAGNYFRLKSTAYKSSGPAPVYLPAATGIFTLTHDSLRKLLINTAINRDIIACFHDDTTIWVGTAGDGLLLISEARTEHLLPGNAITSILKDKEQNFWITTLNNGIFVYKSNFSSVETLSQDPAFSVATLSYNGNKYVVSGSDDGTLQVTCNNHTETVRLSYGLYSRALDLVPMSETRLLACTDNGLYEYDLQKKTTRFFDIKTYKNYEYFAGAYWICSPRYIYRLKDGEYHKIENNLKLYRYTALALVSDSIYYIGTTKGLYKKVNNTLYSIISDSVMKTGVKDLKLCKGKLWVATSGNGVFILANDKIWKHFSTGNSELTSNFCQKLYDDRTSFIWVATNKGFSIFNRNTLTLYAGIPGYPLLSSDDVQDIITDSGYAYVATTKGVNKLKLDKMFTLSPPPVVYVTSFKKDNEVITDPQEQINFTYFKGIINIAFTTTTFLNPLNVLYEYKFSDEAEWHRAPAPELTLFSLKPGTYTLLFRAKKYNSNWGKLTSLSFVIRPTFLQSNYFKALLILAVFALIYLVLIIRVRQVRRRENEKSAIHKKMVELESKALSCQMNPHFIFNSLNTVQQFILIKEEGPGLNYLSEFATLMRQILENSRKPLITLSEEIGFLERYLQLEKIRYNDRFSYAINVDNELTHDDVKIPPVMFQPLLENAIKHGISSFKDGVIKFTVHRQNGYLVGAVDDNGKGIYTGNGRPVFNAVKKESSALKILEERLMLTKNNKGDQGYMTIKDKKESESRGTIITIYIPIQ